MTQRFVLTWCAGCRRVLGVNGSTCTPALREGLDSRAPAGLTAPGKPSSSLSPSVEHARPSREAGT